MKAEKKARSSVAPATFVERVNNLALKAIRESDVAMRAGEALETGWLMPSPDDGYEEVARRAEAFVALIQLHGSPSILLPVRCVSTSPGCGVKSRTRR
jgi:hypothetical protein